MIRREQRHLPNRELACSDEMERPRHCFEAPVGEAAIIPSSWFEVEPSQVVIQLAVPRELRFCWLAWFWSFGFIWSKRWKKVAIHLILWLYFGYWYWFFACGSAIFWFIGWSNIGTPGSRPLIFAFSSSYPQPSFILCCVLMSPISFLKTILPNFLPIKINSSYSIFMGCYSSCPSFPFNSGFSFYESGKWPL